MNIISSEGMAAYEAVHILHDKGYKAYFVGGCVRDMIMGKHPHDYDVATSALPDELKQLFSGYHVIETGIRHGTVTVVINSQNIEITTFRTETTYSDGRHPDRVEFTDDIAIDLARRDFSMNAMAYNPVSEQIIDLFGGKEDITKRQIKCVGNPDIRFKEDALRILRCLRFASTLDFEIDEKTGKAAVLNSSLLKNVSAERIYSEMTKMLCGNAAGRILEDYPEIIFSILPELRPMMNFQQHNEHHCYDVWRHTCIVVSSIPPDPALRWAALLHDSGKPSCFSVDDSGTGHFYGHASRSREIAESVCDRLKFDRETRERVAFIVKRHDTPLEFTEAAFKKYLSKMGENRLRDIVNMEMADNLGQAPAFRFRQTSFALSDGLIDSIKNSEACFSLKTLAVNGNDLIRIGMNGKAVGDALRDILDKVVSDSLPNEKEVILNYLTGKKKDHTDV